MNRSKSPPVNLEKYLEGKRHRFCTYAQGARLYAMAYWSFVTMAKQAGANIKLRKTALVDLDILDDYIEKECKMYNEAVKKGSINGVERAVTNKNGVEELKFWCRAAVYCNKLSKATTKK